MRSLSLKTLLAGAAAALFIVGCSDTTAPDVILAADAEVLASKPESPPGKGKPKPGDPPADYHDAYFSSSKTGHAAGLDYWTDTYDSEGDVATMVPLCFGDQGFCDKSPRIFHGTWTTVVDEVPGYHMTRRAFTIYHRLYIYDGPGWYDEEGKAPILEEAAYVGGFTTSNFIACNALPCSTAQVRLHPKDWVPIEGDGLVTSFDGIVNLVLDSELVEEDNVVVFRAHDGGIHGRVAFSWTAPEV